MLKESLEHLFKKHTRPVSSPLQKLRNRAWEQAWQIGAPDRKREGFRYMTSLKGLYAKKMDDVICSGARDDLRAHSILDSLLLTFINGYYQAGEKPLDTPCVILPMEEALLSYALFIEGRLERRLAKESDFFALLNTAMHSEGLFIYVPPKCKVEAPIELLQALQGGGAHASSRIQLFVGKGAEITLVQRHLILDGDDHFCNGAIDIVLEEEAKCTYIDLTPRTANQWRFHKLTASLKRYSKLDAYFVSGGAISLRQDIDVELLEEGAEVRLFGAAHLKSDAELHTHILVEHVAPGALSRQHFKAALQDSSRASFEGKIYVHKEAQRTLAYQLNNNLILSPKASAFSKPNLEIFADDVKASHGATTSELSEEDLFYMRTRGLSKEMSQKYLTFGFIDALVKELPYPEVVAEARRIYAF